MITPSAVGARLGVHPGTVLRWVTSGVALPDGKVHRLRARRVVGRWRIAESDLDEFLIVIDAAHRPQELVATA